MRFQKVHGTQETKPLNVECCGEIVYVRENIERVTVTQGEEEVEMWEYDEAKIPLSEFMEIFSAITTDSQETQQAQIDYIAMMSDIDLEEV